MAGVCADPDAIVFEAAAAYNPAGTFTVTPSIVKSADVRAVPVGTFTLTSLYPS